MKMPVLLLLIIMMSCNSNESAPRKTGTDTSTAKNTNDKTTTDTAKKPPPPNAKVYSNERFKDVTISKKGLSDYEFLVQGKAQVFEASFGWIIEDGHNELQSGFEMTDAGAPAWGNFSFKVRAVPTPNKTLHLILFEVSAKDGTRQHELPVLLN